MVMVDEGEYKNVMCKKPIYADAAKTTTIGKAIYNLQMFYQSTVTNLAEGNYQSVQVNISLALDHQMCRMYH